MFNSIAFLNTLLWTLVPSVLYGLVLLFFDSQRPKLLHAALLFLVGALLLIPCYLVEYALDMATPWGSSGHLLLNILPSAILEEGAKLLCLALTTRIFLGSNDRWQYYFISGFVVGSGLMFMENFVFLVEYADTYIRIEDRTYMVELTDPLFGGIAGIGLFLILKKRRGHALLFILPPIALHFCHNAGVIVLGDVPWWSFYFLVYVLALCFLAWECLYTYLKTEGNAEKPNVLGNGSLRVLRR